MPSTVSRMPRRSVTVRVAATLAALTLGASLAACADTTRIPPAPTDTGAAEPLFASDEEALAAAVAAYEEYLEASRLATETGGSDVGQLEVLTTPEQFQREEETLQLYRDGSLRTEGASTLRSTELQQWFDAGEYTTVIFYGCLDISELVVLGADGEVIEGDDRQDLLPLEISTQHSSDRELARVASSEVWSGDQRC